MARLDEFRRDIEPILKAACLKCHGPDKQKADFRIDTLDPNLLSGDDVSWWLEVVDVVSSGDMPPPKDSKLADPDRARLIDWLSDEMQTASTVRRADEGHTSFRRLTRYEYNYALQDLLGLPFDFGADLPPESASEDGFKNSSETLQISTSQFELYRELGRKALQKATVRGERPVEMRYDLIPMTLAHELRSKKEIQVHESRAHYRDALSGKPLANAGNNYRGYALQPFNEDAEAKAEADQNEETEVPEGLLVLPAKNQVSWSLGLNLPDRGDLLLRIRAAKAPEATEEVPALRVLFGFQASNNSKVTTRTDVPDFDIDAPPGKARVFEVSIPLGEIARNPYRGQRIAKVNSSESIVIHNLHPKAAVHIESIEVITPAYEQWPPVSHTRIFPKQDSSLDTDAYHREVVETFMRRAWRRSVTKDEVDRKLRLFATLRPTCEDEQEALVEVLATVLASPHFLYATPAKGAESFALASRLATFLWSSPIPDEELLRLASENRLDDPEVLQAQATRMLADPRASRFARHFVRQWLGMELLDHLRVDPKVDGRFDEDLRAAMGREPVAFFLEVLGKNQSILDFIHADFAMINETLAGFYRVEDVRGQRFQRVALGADSSRRGGLLTQPGLLAMNSDGRDSHPLKRGIWILENILNDPPPPPPPSVPEIDIADPEIAKLTLKEQMADHRDDPACMSCHQRIDPWGIALENFDAAGRWRDRIEKEPIDATSTLFNEQELAGIEGLKRHLLQDRQDQIARALVHKMTAYALGRPITFADHAALEEITSQLRGKDDGLQTLVRLLVASDLFRQSK